MARRPFLISFTLSSAHRVYIIQQQNHQQPTGGVLVHLVGLISLTRPGKSSDVEVTEFDVERGAAGVCRPGGGESRYARPSGQPQAFCHPGGESRHARTTVWDCFVV